MPLPRWRREKRKNKNKKRETCFRKGTAIGDGTSGESGATVGASGGLHQKEGESGRVPTKRGPKTELEKLKYRATVAKSIDR